MRARGRGGALARCAQGAAEVADQAADLALPALALGRLALERGEDDLLELRRGPADCAEAPDRGGAGQPVDELVELLDALLPLGAAERSRGAGDGRHLPRQL